MAKQWGQGGSLASKNKPILIGSIGSVLPVPPTHQPLSVRLIPTVCEQELPETVLRPRIACLQRQCLRPGISYPGSCPIRRPRAVLPRRRARSSDRASANWSTRPVRVRRNAKCSIESLAAPFTLA